MNKKDRIRFEELFGGLQLIKNSMNPNLSEASRKGDFDVGMRKIKSWIKEEMRDVRDGKKAS